jgi:hypothetical protein
MRRKKEDGSAVWLRVFVPGEERSIEHRVLAERGRTKKAVQKNQNVYSFGVGSKISMV